MCAKTRELTAELNAKLGVTPSTALFFGKDTMRRLAIASALLVAAGAATVTTADARPFGRGYGGYNGGGYAYRGGGYGRRGLSTGAAVGLGIAGLAAGAVAAGAANSYYYGRPYGYGYYGRPYGYYDYGY